MPRILLLLAVIFSLWYLWQYYKKTPAEKRPALLWRFGFYTLLAFVLLMVATGRAHWIAAFITAMIPLVKTLAKYLLPFIFHKSLSRGKEQDKQRAEDQSQQRPSTPNQPMSESEALQILGLEPGADREAIINAHRRLIQKLHTDRGGNDYLAAKINAAKDRLIKESQV